MGFYFCLEFAGSRGIENSLKDGAQEPYRCALDQIVSSMSVMFAHPYIPESNEVLAESNEDSYDSVQRPIFDFDPARSEISAFAGSLDEIGGKSSV